MEVVVMMKFDLKDFQPSLKLVSLQVELKNFLFKRKKIKKKKSFKNRKNKKIKNQKIENRLKYQFQIINS